MEKITKDEIIFIFIMSIVGMVFAIPIMAGIWFILDIVANG